MKIIIIGRTEILYKTTKLLVEKGHNIPLIITSKEAPEYKIGRKEFEELAINIGADFISSAKIDSAEVRGLMIKHNDLDIGISMNYSGIIHQNFIDKFKIGILNAHGGDLPRYRGNACQAWAILNGEEKIGLCVHKMIGDELDSGDIIVREYFPINTNTKISECWKWMSKKIPNLFLEALNKLNQNPQYVFVVQSKNPKETLRCYPRLPEDGKIDWSKSNLEILRLINASNKPYSGAICKYKGVKITIWDAGIFEDNENYCAAPGQISKINEDGSIDVICGKGKLKINIVEYKGETNKPGKWVKSIRTRFKKYEKR